MFHSVQEARDPINDLVKIKEMLQNAPFNRTNIIASRVRQKVNEANRQMKIIVPYAKG